MFVPFLAKFGLFGGVLESVQISVSFDDLSESKDLTVKFEAVQILLYIWEFDATLIWPRPLEQPGRHRPPILLLA